MHREHTTAGTGVPGMFLQEIVSRLLILSQGLQHVHEADTPTRCVYTKQMGAGDAHRGERTKAYSADLSGKMMQGLLTGRSGTSAGRSAGRPGRPRSAPGTCGTRTCATTAANCRQIGITISEVASSSPIACVQVHVVEDRTRVRVQDEEGPGQVHHGQGGSGSASSSGFGPSCAKHKMLTNRTPAGPVLRQRLRHRFVSPSNAQCAVAGGRDQREAAALVATGAQLLAVRPHVLRQQ